jgi:hypothetical protein
MQGHLRDVPIFVLLLSLAFVCGAADTATPLEPIVVHGKSDLLGSKRAHFESLLPCLGACEVEKQPRILTPMERALAEVPSLDPTQPGFLRDLHINPNRTERQDKHGDR